MRLQDQPDFAGLFIDFRLNTIQFTQQNGFGINWIANLCILPMYGFQVTGGQAFTMGLIFTVISVARGYIIRRWFNARLQRAAQRMAEVMA